MMYVVKQMFGELFREKTRVLLTIFAIAWGTFAISTMLSVGEGLRVTFGQALANIGHNLLIVRHGRTTKPYRGMHANVVINLTRKDYNVIKKLPNITAISPVYTFSGKMRFLNKESQQNIYAVAPNYARIHEIEVKPGGRFLSTMDMQQQKSVIVLGTETQKNLQKTGQLKVGQHVFIQNQPFLVVGLMVPKTQLSGRRRPADAFVNWIPLSTYEAMQNPQQYSSIDITYTDPKLLTYLEQHIQNAVAINHRADPTDDNVVHFVELAKRQERINTFFFGMQLFLGIVGALTLLVAGVGIANVMFASVHRATREIGIRMAIGARTYNIVLHYISESLLATFIGGCIGLLMSWSLVVGIEKVPMRGRFFDFVGKPHPILSLSVIFAVITVLGVVGVLAGLFPAIKAARIDPAEALTYE